MLESPRDNRRRGFNNVSEIEMVIRILFSIKIINKYYVPEKLCRGDDC